jgi:hypothetical protein
MQQQEITRRAEFLLESAAGRAVTQSTIHRNTAGENNDGATDPRDTKSVELLMSLQSCDRVPCYRIVTVIFCETTGGLCG